MYMYIFNYVFEAMQFESECVYTDACITALLLLLLLLLSCQVEDLCRVIDTELGYADGVKPWTGTSKVCMRI